MRNINRADKNLIKKINTVSILKVIRENGPISRADISKIIGLNSATVSNNVSELLNKKIIKETGSGESSGGRRPIFLELNNNRLYIIGVDMGIKKVTTGLIDIDGNIINKVVVLFKEKSSINDIMKIIKKSIYEVIKGYDETLEKVAGIGMGIHGIVDIQKGTLIYAPAFNWHNVEISRVFEEEFKVPIIIENDTRAMALGEKWFGIAKDSQDFILLNIGTGIGAGIYLNDDLYRGNNFGAGEIGHVNMSNEKIICACGKYGCFEALASGVGIVNRFINEIKRGRKSNIINKFDILDITSEIIYKEALGGDELSIEILKETGKYIGKAVSMLINTLNPSMILIAGGVSKAEEFIYEEIKKVVTEKCLTNNFKNIYIGQTHLKDNAGVVGAAALIIRDIFSV